MKKTITLFALFFISSVLFSQTKDTSVYKNGLTINLEALLVRDIKLTYTHKIAPGKYLETMVSYSFPFGENSRVNDNYFWGLKDPFFYYGRAQVRAGLKQYITRKFYVGSMLLYSYGHFDKGDAWYVGDKMHYITTRNKNDIEILFKTGFTFHDHQLLQDLYMGFGYRYKFLSDDIYEDLWGDTHSPVPHPPYPYHVDRRLGLFTVHLGYQIGYGK